ncbi:MAG: UPF0146 family protein [Halobacteriota archaeon]
MGLSQKHALSLSEFVKRNYSRRVVEVGCGKRSRTAFILTRSLDIIVTDILESEAVDGCIKPFYIKDDITSPDLNLYYNAQLLYSIRPPLEIQHSILNVARIVQADVLIKPLDDEIIDILRMYLKNHKGIAFYHFQAERAQSSRC